MTAIETLFDRTDALPVIPRVMQELIASFNDDGIDTRTIVQHISADQVLSAKLLQMANSAYYKAPGAVATIPDAVDMLGLVNLRTLVISIGLRGSFLPVPGIDSRQFWRHSVHTAVASRYLAGPLGQDAELAFTIGLLRSIGQLVMHLAMPETMLKMDQQISPLDASRLAVERDAFDYTHIDVSAELARRWRFPAVFSGAIAGSANPLVQAHFDPLAGEVHIAAWRAGAEEHHLTVEAMEQSWPADVAARLALPKDMVLQSFPSWDLLSDGMRSLMT